MICIIHMKCFKPSNIWAIIVILGILYMLIDKIDTYENGDHAIATDIGPTSIDEYHAKMYDMLKNAGIEGGPPNRSEFIKTIRKRYRQEKYIEWLEKAYREMSNEIQRHENRNDSGKSNSLY